MRRTVRGDRAVSPAAVCALHPWHDTLREEPRTDTRAMAPAAASWSTVEDLARWAAFLADPDPRGAGRRKGR
ncbi:hypothetical protein [Micromonospora sp. C28SCA-DRY-2]|uniref:hypothetical protein n=1 Tax=Micromonospora sp. C28SCA-DRY-2 TaxID=3059522 RepID=UPI0034A099A1